MCQMRIHISQVNNFCIHIFNKRREVTRITTTTILYLKRVTHLAYNNYSSMWPSEESCKRY